MWWCRDDDLFFFLFLLMNLMVLCFVRVAASLWWLMTRIIKLTSLTRTLWSAGTACSRWWVIWFIKDMKLLYWSNPVCGSRKNGIGSTKGWNIFSSNLRDPGMKSITPPPPFLRFSASTATRCRPVRSACTPRWQRASLAVATSTAGPACCTTCLWARKPGPSVRSATRLCTAQTSRGTCRVDDGKKEWLVQ